MSPWQKFRLAVLFPLLGFAISVGTVLLLRILIIFILRPSQNFLSGIWEGFLQNYTLDALTSLGITNIEMVDSIIGTFLFVCFSIGVWIVTSAFNEALSEAGFNPINNLLFLAFGFLGKYFWFNGLFLGRQSVYILLAPLVILICFSNTILDYREFVNGVQSGDLSNIPINIFSDQFFGEAESKVTYADSVVSWIIADNASISNFFNYWVHSLRASVLGVRVEGAWQILGFIANIFGSILLLAFGYITAVSTFETVLGKVRELHNITTQTRSSGVSQILAFLITTILSAFGFWWAFIGSSTNLATVPTIHYPFLSLGETALLADNQNPDRLAGIQAFAKGKFEESREKLQVALNTNPNDPETLIYRNNASIGANNSHTIAVAAPIQDSPNTASEILRGVAQAQNEINAQGGINGTPLRVILADDYNRAPIATQVATELAKIDGVLGVIGHFSSESTLAAAPVYQEQGLVAISPTSTSTQIATLGANIFRTAPSDAIASQALADYTRNQLGERRAAVFFNSKSNYSRSLKDEFKAAFDERGGQTVAEIDLANPQFNAEQAYSEARDQGMRVLALFPNSATLDQALQIVKANQGRLAMIGGDSPYQIRALQQGQADLVGLVLAVPWHILGNPDAPFPQAADRLWGADVNWRTAMAYDATRALIAAIQANPTRAGIQQALADPDFVAEGAAGEVRFLQSGDRDTPIQLVRVVQADESRSGTGYDFVPLR